MSKIVLTDEASAPAIPAAGTTIIYTAGGVLQVLNSGGTPAAPILPSIFMATGQLLYASAPSTPTALTIGTAGQFLGVSGGIPAWTNLFTGTLPNALGPAAAAGASTEAARRDHVHALPVSAQGDIMYANSASTVTSLPIGVSGRFLRVNGGANAPEWTTASASDVGAIASSTLSADGDMLYRDGGGAVTRLPVGTPNQFLVATTVGMDVLPQWTSAGATGLSLWQSGTKPIARDNLSATSYAISAFTDNNGSGTATPATGVTEIASPATTADSDNTPYLYLDNAFVDPFNCEVIVNVNSSSGLNVATNNSIVIAVGFDQANGGGSLFSIGSSALVTLLLYGDGSYDFMEIGGSIDSGGGPIPLSGIWFKIAIQRGLVSIYSKVSPTQPTDWNLIAKGPLTVPPYPGIDGADQIRLCLGLEATVAPVATASVTWGTVQVRDLL